MKKHLLFRIALLLIPPEGYTLGQTYQVTVSVTSTAASHGFQVTAENNANQKTGIWTATAANTQVTPSGNHVTHTTPNVSGIWTMDWTAPATDQGAVTFYASLNAVNLNNANSGDQAVTTSSTGYNANVLSAQDVNFAALKIYPVPAAEQLTLELPSTITTAAVVIYSYTGTAVLNANISTTQRTLDVTALQSGLYLVSINANGRKTTRTFIKK